MRKGVENFRTDLVPNSVRLFKTFFGGHVSLVFVYVLKVIKEVIIRY